MPAEQRIIGGGLLLVGIAIVLILLYVFSWGGMTPKEGYEEVLMELYPRYVAAEEKDDYLAVRRAAEEIRATLDEAGEAAVLKLVQGDAALGKQSAVACARRIENGTFAKNADGLYAFGGGFFRQATHRALTQLARLTDEDLKAVADFRRNARAARQALEDARIASGAALELPPPARVAKDDAPIVSPNPIYVHDTELYRVFGVQPAALEGALATKPQAGKARSAALRWNKGVAPSNLARDVQALPELAESLRTSSAEYQRHAADAASDPEAAGELAKILETAATRLGRELDAESAEAYREHAEAFRKGPAIATVMRQEAELVLAYGDTIRDLGACFAKTFPE